MVPDSVPAVIPHVVPDPVPAVIPHVVPVPVGLLIGESLIRHDTPTHVNDENLDLLR